MKLKSLMRYAVPISILFIILVILVVQFVLENTQPVKLRYHIPFTSIHFPKIEEGKPDFIEIDVVFVILISITIGIAIMIFFAVIAGVGWQYYALKSKRRESKARKWLWEKRENAIALSLMGHYDRAVEEFGKIIDKDKPHTELYVGLAEAFERKGDHQQAIENYNSILAREPKNMRALFGAAENWEALGNYTEALTLYNRVLDVDPDSPKASQKFRELLEKSTHYVEAIDEYQRPPISQETHEVLASLSILKNKLHDKNNQYDK